MGYAATTSITNTITSDAQFRAWGSAYAAKWASMGLLQIVDAAQINWATVATPGAINTVKGYEIWYFADALQATVPVYVKIEYGSGSGAADGALWLSFGTGDNGAGALTGVVSTRVQVKCTASAGNITHIWSGDTNRALVAVMGAAAATSMNISFERTVDINGAVTSEGILFIYRSGSTWAQTIWNQQTGQAAVAETQLGCSGSGQAPYGVGGLQIAVYPIMINKGVFCYYPLGMFMYENATIAAGSTITFTVYGAAHTYYTEGSTAGGSPGKVGFSTGAVMLRYE